MSTVDAVRVLGQVVAVAVSLALDAGEFAAAASRLMSASRGLEEPRRTDADPPTGPASPLNRSRRGVLPISAKESRRARPDPIDQPRRSRPSGMVVRRCSANHRRAAPRAAGVLIPRSSVVPRTKAGTGIGVPRPLNSGLTSVGSAPRTMRAQAAISEPATRNPLASRPRGNRTPTIPTSAPARQIREMVSGIARGRETRTGRAAPLTARRQRPCSQG